MSRRLYILLKSYFGVQIIEGPKKMRTLPCNKCSLESPTPVKNDIWAAWVGREHGTSAHNPTPVPCSGFRAFTSTP